MNPAQELTVRLGGCWRGSYGTARCPAHDDHSPSLSIPAGRRGGPSVKCHAGCDPRDVIRALRNAGRWLAATWQQQPAAENGADRRRRDEQTRQYLLGVWRSAVPIDGTPAERYLRNRGIAGALPPSLRYHRGLKHIETGLLLPCLVAAVQGPDRSISGLHRTFLRNDGPDKARVSPKKMLGKVAGGAVRLAPAAAELAIGEGIETCLSFQRATGIATWAALSTSGMTAIVLPALPLAKTVYVLIDLDPAGESAAQAVAARLVRDGRWVKLARPIAGKDFNDALREAVNAG